MNIDDDHHVDDMQKKHTTSSRLWTSYTRTDYHQKKMNKNITTSR